MENVNFIVDVLNYAKEDAANCVVRSTAAANALMQARAAELIKKYINAGMLSSLSSSSSPSPPHPLIIIIIIIIIIITTCMHYSFALSISRQSLTTSLTTPLNTPLVPPLNTPLTTLLTPPPLHPPSPSHNHPLHHPITTPSPPLYHPTFL